MQFLYSYTYQHSGQQNSECELRLHHHGFRSQAFSIDLSFGGHFVVKVFVEAATEAAIFAGCPIIRNDSIRLNVLPLS